MSNVRDAAIVVYTGEDDVDDNDGRYDCLNPQCSNTTISAGVCFGCANNGYNPSEDGLDVPNSVLWL